MYRVMHYLQSTYYKIMQFEWRINVSNISDIEQKWNILKTYDNL